MKRLALLCLVLLLSAAPAAAQDDVPLLDLLALVPDDAVTDVGMPMFSYIDLELLATARGIEPPTVDDVLNETEVFDIWLASAGTVASGPPYLLRYGLMVGEMRAAAGFTLFDVDRALGFGRAPETGLIVQGDGISAEAVGAALEAQDYTAAEVDGVTLWCGPVGCENGSQTNVNNLNPANPFGGHLGRQEPLAILPDATLLNSPMIAIVENMIGASTGEVNSLAEDDDVRAAVLAAANVGVIRQADLYSVRDVGLIPTTPPNLNPQQLERLPTPTPGPGLPAYSRALFADVYQPDSNLQVAVIALVYPNAEIAETANAILLERLPNVISFAARRPLLELLTERGALLPAPSVFEAEGLAVAVIEFPYASPTNEVVEDTLRPFIRPTGMVYRVFIQEILQRSLTLLAVP